MTQRIEWKTLSIPDRHGDSHLSLYVQTLQHMGTYSDSPAIQRRVVKTATLFQNASRPRMSLSAILWMARWKCWRNRLNLFFPALYSKTERLKINFKMSSESDETEAESLVIWGFLVLAGRFPSGPQRYSTLWRNICLLSHIIRIGLNAFIR
jgi:hypothetical protein